MVPVIEYVFFQEDNDTENEDMTFKDLKDKFDNNELNHGDIEYVTDIFSNIWYDQTTHYTYMTFKSMDDHRTDPWGYDAGYPYDITDIYKIKDKVRLKIQMSEETDESGNARLVGHIKEIKNA
jgi:hypothetical protein